MKQKQNNLNHSNNRQGGFTVIELLVVLSIMVVIATVVIIDFNRQRNSRSIVLAKNETVTNMRKIQGYMLSSRNLPSGEAAKFYIAEFNMNGGSTVGQFNVHAVDNDFVLHRNLETIKLPSGVRYKNFKIDPTSKGDPVAYQCLQIIFSSPFGKMYVNGSANCNNNIEQTLMDPVALSTLAQRRAYLELDSGFVTQNTPYVVVNPISGQISTN